MKKYLSLFALLFLVSCGSTSNNSIQNNSVEDNNSSNSSSSDSSKAQSFSSTTIDFTNVTGLTGGTDLVGSNNQENLDKLKAYMNSGAKIVDSIDTEGKVFYQNCKDLGKLQALTIGSSSATGSITFNFKVEVAEVKLNIQPYWKSYAYGDTTGVNADKNAKLNINEELVDLSVSTDDEAKTEVEREFTFTTPTDSLKLENLDGRVLINSVVVTYIVKEK